MIAALFALLVVAGWWDGTRSSVIWVLLSLGVPGIAAYALAHSSATEEDVRQFLEPPPPTASEWEMEQLANWRWHEHSLRKHADGRPFSDADQRRLGEIKTRISFLEEEIWPSQHDEHT
jgi:hypothetical protein